MSDGAYVIPFPGRSRDSESAHAPADAWPLLSLKDMAFLQDRLGRENPRMKIWIEPTTLENRRSGVVVNMCGQGCRHRMEIDAATPLWHIAREASNEIRRHWTS